MVGPSSSVASRTSTATAWACRSRPWQALLRSLPTSSSTRLPPTRGRGCCCRVWGSAQQKQKQQQQQRRPLADAINAFGGPFQGLVGTPAYAVLKLGALVLGLGLVDAAYSGDWSRIGVISTETEQQLQTAVWVVVFLHSLCGAAAAAVAQQGGRPWLAPAVKGFLFGTLAVYEEAAGDRP